MAWIAIFVAMYLKTSLLTLPFGWALFFLKGVAPPEITTLAIFRGVLPFIAIQSGNLVAMPSLVSVMDLETYLAAIVVVLSGWSQTAFGNGYLSYPRRSSRCFQARLGARIAHALPAV